MAKRTKKGDWKIRLRDFFSSSARVTLAVLGVLFFLLTVALTSIGAPVFLVGAAAVLTVMCICFVSRKNDINLASDRQGLVSPTSQSQSTERSLEEPYIGGPPVSGSDVGEKSPEERPKSPTPRVQ